MLPEDKMPEAEVSLRLGFFLIKKGITASDVKVAIDGAQVRTGDQIRFDVNGFLASQGWHKCSTNDRWQGTYKNDKWDLRIEVHSVPGLGDVVAQLKSGEILRVECKKGPLGRSKSSQEYPLIREALGQLLTVDEVEESDLLAIAVPSSPKFENLATKWREAPLIKRFGLKILTVRRDNEVNGF